MLAAKNFLFGMMLAVRAYPEHMLPVTLHIAKRPARSVAVTFCTIADRANVATVQDHTLPYPFLALKRASMLVLDIRNLDKPLRALQPDPPKNGDGNRSKEPARVISKNAPLDQWR